MDVCLYFKARTHTRHEGELEHQRASVSETQLGCIWRKWDFFWFAASPVNTSNTFLYDALDLLEHVGVLFIDPVGQVAAVVQDLSGKGGQE